MTNQPVQIIAFPAQLLDDETPHSHLSEAEAVQEAKLQAMRMLNRVATGQLAELPEDAKENIRIINSFCLRWGYSPIDCDF